MRFFPILVLATMMFLATAAYAQLSPDDLPPTDEYNNVPPGLLMSSETAAPLPEETTAPEETSVMTMDDIAAAYKKGDYPLVLKHVVPIAKGGYPLAQEMLGIMYRNGQGVLKDPEEAVVWLTKAADVGRPVAEHHLATMSYSGEGMPPDPVRALMWLHIAIAHYTDGPEKTQAEQDRDNVSSQLSRRDKDRAYSLAHDWLEKKNEAGLLPPQRPN